MEEEEVGEEEGVEGDGVKEEVSKLKKIGLLVWRVWLEAVDQVISWLELTSADYRDVVTRLATEGEQESSETLLPKEEEEEEVARPPSPHGATPPQMETGAITTVAEVHSHHEEEEKEEEEKEDEEDGLPPPPPPPPPDPSRDILARVRPSEVQKQEAEKVQKQLEAVTEQYTQRPKRLLEALYYWSLSHFDYMVFFFVILAIMRGGVAVSIGYAAILFLWGLLSIPWPSKRFWVTLIFYTMFVLVVTYIYLCVLMALASPPTLQTLLPPHPFITAFVWLLGVDTGDVYFGVSIFSLLLLMCLIFHRGLLRVSSVRRRGRRRGRE